MLWNYVIPHFEKFLNELELSVADRTDGESKANRVARSLFAENSQIITQIRLSTLAAMRLSDHMEKAPRQSGVPMLI